MLVWRGHGIYVIFLAVLAVILAVAPAAFLAERMFPDTTLSLDLLRLTTPWFGAGLAAGFFFVAILVWRIGKSVNDGHNSHTLFFIPFQFWAIIFALIGGAGVILAFPGDGLETARGEFVDKCVTYEEDAFEKECTCWAQAFADNATEDVQMPFYLFLSDAWGASDTNDDKVLTDFISLELSRVPAANQDSFFIAMDETYACFPE